MVPKRELISLLPYLVKASIDLRTRLKRTIERNLWFCKSKIIFESKCRLNTLFRFKDSLEKKIRSGIVYPCLIKMTFCNFQSIKSAVELNSLLSKFFCYISQFVTPFLFYKNSFYKNHEAENRPKIKNFVRITPGSRSRDL